MEPVSRRSLATPPQGSESGNSPGAGGLTAPRFPRPGRLPALALLLAAAGPPAPLRAAPAGPP
ncbi:hypothetical protein, partial [Dankookia rubra]|uniref:hypothetical protein n=1 Tax=Dankookia rubra TaxID=1442381 RepID=UPI0019D62050